MSILIIATFIPAYPCLYFMRDSDTSCTKNIHPSYFVSIINCAFEIFNETFRFYYVSRLIQLCPFSAIKLRRNVYLHILCIQLKYLKRGTL